MFAFPVVHEALRYDVTEHGFLLRYAYGSCRLPSTRVDFFALLLGGHFMAFIRAELSWLGELISDVNRTAANKSS